MTLESTEVDEQSGRSTSSSAYPGEGPAFESYRQGLFNNRIWLQKADGTRGSSTTAASPTPGLDGGKLGFEYLSSMPRASPSDYQLVYETPSRVLTIPLEFEFKDVPLAREP